MSFMSFGKIIKNTFSMIENFLSPERVLIYIFSIAMIYYELCYAWIKYINKLLKDTFNSINIEEDPTTVPDGQLVVYNTDKIKYQAITDPKFDIPIYCGFLSRKQIYDDDSDDVIIDEVQFLSREIEAGPFTLSGLSYHGNTFTLTKNSSPGLYIEFWRPKSVTVIGQKLGDKIIPYTKFGLKSEQQ